jgi:penicillin amidase
MSTPARRRTRSAWWTIPLAIVAVLVLVAASVPLGFLVLTRVSVAATAGTRSHLALDGRVTIARDARGVAHIRATSDRDLFFGEGYAMAADRLFQMDLTRRFTEGRLAEVLGSPLVGTDRSMRSYAIEAIAARDYAHVSATERSALAAFAAGVNAAATREPVPPEYRLLVTRFRPWRPQDAIEVGFATVLDLDDSADAVIARDAIHRQLGERGTDFFLPLTDPRYDVPTNGDPIGPIARLPDAPPGFARSSPAAHANVARAITAFDDRPTLGSNGWVVGAARTTVGRAILANDPHLSLGIPAVWWLVEARSPGLHIAGAVLVGTLGVTLGHNADVAWGVTAAETAAMRLVHEAARGSDEFFEHGRWVRAAHHRETIAVRFGAPVTVDTLVTPNGTVLRRDGTAAAYLRDWLAARTIEDPLAPFLAVDRSRDVGGVIAAMRNLAEPALNLFAADSSGRVAYHLVGGVPRDEAWARWAVDGDTPEPPLLAFAGAPRVDPSRDALVVTSNNRPAAGKPRLAPFWASPYRAYEIRRLLAVAGATGKLTPQAVGAPQFAADSPAERELATLVVAAADRVGVDGEPGLRAAVAELRGFDGRFVATSRAATLVAALRRPMYAALTRGLGDDTAAQYIGSSATLTVLLRALRERPRGWVADWDRFAVDALRVAVAAVGTPTPTFGDWDAQPLAHPLAPFGLGWWNGPTLIGRGGGYAPAVQNHGHGQSFRAEWIAGDWDAGTIDLDAGESGEPGSPHYADQSGSWQRFERATLPFSDAAVAAATRSTLILNP